MVRCFGVPSSNDSDGECCSGPAACSWLVSGYRSTQTSGSRSLSPCLIALDGIKPPATAGARGISARLRSKLYLSTARYIDTRLAAVDV
jgi:hypothetical protein